MRPVLILLTAAAACAPALAATTKIDTHLTAAAEVPGPGKGAGTATLTFDSDKGQVCYMLMSSGTDTPTMAHIHKGAAGVAGGVVVALAPPATGMSEGCAPLAGDVLADIVAHPGNYYVNVHTAAFPAGAMRGQLK
jgi:hypothetical protein